MELETLEKTIFREVIKHLAANHGVRVQTAKSLGICVRTLRNYLARMKQFEPELSKQITDSEHALNCMKYN